MCLPDDSNYVVGAPLLVILTLLARCSLRLSVTEPSTYTPKSSIIRLREPKKVYKHGVQSDHYKLNGGFLVIMHDRLEYRVEQTHICHLKQNKQANNRH